MYAVSGKDNLLFIEGYRIRIGQIKQAEQKSVDDLLESLGMQG